MRTPTEPPMSFWIVTICALLWNVVELYFGSYEMAFLEETATGEEFETLQSVPYWYAVVFLVALFSELLGSIMLLFRKKLATTLFAIAFLSLLFVELYWLLSFDITKTSVVFSIIIPLAVIIIAGFLYVYSKKATKKGWLT